MGLLMQLALVGDSPNLGVSELTTVAAALQKQLARDLVRFWDVNATLIPVTALEDVPVGSWPIIVRDDIDNEAAGVHCDTNGQPMALVTFDQHWSVTASHEMLEMVVDPFGRRTVAGQSLEPNQGRVEYLVEVADPIGDSNYPVNDVKVSDFITPNYYDPLAGAGVQYCCTGALTGPRTLLPNGYVTWHDPVGNEWWQQSRFTPAGPELTNLGPQIDHECGIRSAVDPLAARRRRDSGGISATRWETTAADNSRTRGVAESRRAKAEAWRKRIAQIKARPRP
ncbi:MAG: hypothetical protein JWR26_1693 [Pedosphaera sp.]|nr:hypothetical protein [Pedosphaera sp.]